MNQRYGVRAILLFTLLLSSASLALGDCIVTAASATAPTDGGAPPVGAQISIIPGGVPATMPIYTNGEAISEIVIYDDGNTNSVSCFGSNQLFTITINGTMTSPALTGSPTDAAAVAVFDSAGGNGLSVVASSTVHTSTTQPTTTITLSVVRPGTNGNATLGTGAAVVLHNLRFSTQAPLPANAHYVATIGSSLSGGVLFLSPASLLVGTVVYTGPLELSPSSLTFNPQIVNSTTTQTVKVTNAGNLPITISNVSSSGDASQSNTCGTVVAVNSSCTMTVGFTPGDLGQRTGSITISNNTNASPQQIPVFGSGIASPGVPTITSLSPAYAVAGTAPFSLTVRGTNFAQGTTVLWNGLPRTTTWVDGSTVQAAISASDVASVGTVNISVVNAGSGASNQLLMQIVPTPMPSSILTNFVPHIVSGNGFTTKITLLNPTGQTNNAVINYVSQAGSLLGSETHSIPPYGVVPVQTPASATPQWAAVGSDTTLDINVLVEQTNGAGQIVNAFGYNQSTAATDLTLPVEFQPSSGGGAYSRTSGVALANVSDVQSSVTLQVVDASGNKLASFPVVLPPYGQTAVDLSLITQITSALPPGDFIGSIAVAATQPVAAIAIGDDFGSVAATPPVSGRSTAGVDDFIGICPAAADVAKLQGDFSLSFESDPTAGTLLCRGLEGSADLTALQLKAYQALRILNAVTFDVPLPFTAKRPYEWLTGAIVGIRFRGDITTSFCCSPARVINIAVGPQFPALLTSGWIGQTTPGLDDIPSTIVRLARVSEGFADSCQTKDQTIAEMGPWAATLDWYDFIAAHSGTFFSYLNPLGSVGYYRSAAASDARAVVANQFCAAGVLETQPALLDFGLQAYGDPVGMRTITVNAGQPSTTSFRMAGTSLSGDNSQDFSIVSDTCRSNSVPPSCSVTVAFNPTTAIGSRSASLNIGTSLQPAPLSIPLRGSVNSQKQTPAANFIYIVPHVVTGRGFATRFTIANLADVAGDVAVNYISTSGLLLHTDDYPLAGSGTLRFSTPDSTRFGQIFTTEWAIIGSRTPVSVNVFFENGDTNGNVFSTVGFNSSSLFSNFVFPVDFDPAAMPGGVPRTSGLAIANPSIQPVNVTLTLINQQGRSLGVSTMTLGPYAQTSIDLMKVPEYQIYLPQGSFTGSVRVQSSGPIAAIALEDDMGPFSATPVFPLN